MSALTRLLGRFTGSGSVSKGADRRRHSRVDMDWVAVIKSGSRTLTVQMQNLSASGALISPRLDLPTGSYVTMSVPEAGVTLRACIVRHGAQGSGVSFDDPAAVQNLRERLELD